LRGRPLLSCVALFRLFVARIAQFHAFALDIHQSLAVGLIAVNRTEAGSFSNQDMPHARIVTP